MSELTYMHVIIACPTCGGPIVRRVDVYDGVPHVAGSTNVCHRDQCWQEMDIYELVERTRRAVAATHQEAA